MVIVFLTLKVWRICQWSCMFSPTPGEACFTGDSVFAENVGRADAGQFEQLRRANRAGGENDFALIAAA